MKTAMKEQYEKWKKTAKEEDLFRTPGMRKKRREQATYYQVKALLIELLADEVANHKIEQIILYAVRHCGFFNTSEYHHVWRARWINTVLLLEDLKRTYPDSPRFHNLYQGRVEMGGEKVV